MNIPFAKQGRRGDADADAVDHTFGGKKLSPRPHYELTVVELIMHRHRQSSSRARSRTSQEQSEQLCFVDVLWLCGPITE